MRRIQANGGRSDALAAIRRLCEWDFERARSGMAQAATRLQQAQGEAAEEAAKLQELVQWAAGPGVQDRHAAMHRHVLEGIKQSRLRQQFASADSDARDCALVSARKVLVLVQARQKALDRVAERIVSRTAMSDAARDAREQDEQWLCSTDVPGSCR